MRRVDARTALCDDLVHANLDRHAARRVAAYLADTALG